MSNLSDDILPGDEKRPALPLWRYAAIALAVFVVTGGIVGLIGLVTRGSWQRYLPADEEPPKMSFIDAQGGSVLMLETTKTTSRVAVQRVGETGWRYISTDDLATTNPALSINGLLVAYISQRQEGTVVLVPLEIRSAIPLTTSKSINSEQIAAAGKNIQSDDLALCKWSDVAWSPDSRLLAFFACTSRPQRSFAIVASNIVSPTLSIQLNTKLESNEARQVRWLSQTEILVTQPSDSDTFGTSTVLYPITIP